jgi:iron complex transport system substrate-binding protein
MSLSHARHRLLAGLSAVALCAGLASCGQVEDSSTQNQPAGAPSAGFPVTITHKFGSTTINSAPQRVVVIGTSTDDLDAAVALGVTPVAFFTKDQVTPDGLYPWLKGKVDPAKTQIVNASNGVDTEQVAKLTPDLILATGDYGLDQEYENLSKTGAAVIGYESEWGKQSWQQHVEVVGKALGKQAEAQRLIDDVEAKITGVRTALPGLAGKTFTASAGNTPGKVFTLVSNEDFAVKLIEQLGLKLSPTVGTVEKVAGSPTGVVGPEQFDKLDANLVLIGFTTPDNKNAFEGSQLVRNMAAVRSGNYLAVDMVTISQLRYPSALGIPWVLDSLRPALEKVAKG